MAARIAMIAMTTSNSISVKDRRRELDMSKTPLLKPTDLHFRNTTPEKSAHPQHASTLTNAP
jgi:hypothetical protein